MSSVRLGCVFFTNTLPDTVYALSAGVPVALIEYVTVSAPAPGASVSVVVDVLSSSGNAAPDTPPVSYQPSRPSTPR